MTTHPQNGVLPDRGSVTAPERSDEVRSGGAETGSTIPPPPPPPRGVATAAARRTAASLTAEELDAAYKANRRQRREARKSDLVGKVRSVNPRYWLWAGGCAALVFGAITYRNYRVEIAAIDAARTAAIDAARTAPIATTDTTSAPLVEGIPNPLMELPLTGQAQWILGWDNGTLSPVRSANAIAQLLDGSDACAAYIGMNERAAVVIAAEPQPGFSPLCGAREEALPDDSAPLPPSTLPAETATTVAAS